MRHDCLGADKPNHLRQPHGGVGLGPELRAGYNAGTALGAHSPLVPGLLPADNSTSQQTKRSASSR